MVTLEGTREAQRRSWVLGLTDWGIQARPNFRDSLLAAYRAGQELAEAGKVQDASTRWRAASVQAQMDSSSTVAIWLVFHAGESLSGARQWKEADDCYREAVERASSGPAIAAQLLRVWADTFRQRNDFGNAEERYQQALAQERRLGGENLAAAGDLQSLGRLSLAHGDLPKADGLISQSLTIRESLAPDSLAVANSLNNLGNVSYTRSDFSKALEYQEQALAIQDRLAPGGLDVSTSLANLGKATYQLGDAVKAEEYMRGSLEIRDRLAPGTSDIAESLNSLGELFRSRGNFVKAEEYHKRALAIREELAPGSLDVATSLNNLGATALDREDLVSAENYYRRSLAITEKLIPGTTDVAQTLLGLGELFKDRGDFPNAEEYYKRASAILEKVAPGGLDFAWVLHDLGLLSRDRNDDTRAEFYLQQVLALREGLPPDGQDLIGDTLKSLAILAQRRGDLNLAEEYGRKAVSLQERLNPENYTYVESLAVLARIVRDRGQLDNATQLFLKSLDILDLQTGHLGGTSEVRSGFRALFTGNYRDAMDLLLKQSKPDVAFHVAERSRARSLLEMLTERDLVFAADLPAEVRTARKSNAVAYDRAQAELASVNPQTDSARVEQLRNRLQELQKEREEITERVRRASPRLAALQYPQPLDLRAARQALDRGTALLSYVVGEKHTVLFVVLPTGAEPALSVFTLPVPEKMLRQKVTELRTLIEKAGGRDPVAQLKELYTLLIQPAESVINGSERLLIVPDGPLQVLPFAALRRKSGQYLVEWKPLDTALSATVYAEVKQRRNDEATKPLTLAAFGDPLYPSGESAHPANIGDDELRSATERGLNFSRLLFSGQEVESIAGLFAEHADKYLRGDATEEHAKALGKEVRYLHFATHGFLDEKLPLNSGLALTIPAKLEQGHENGLLQAWEIFEQMRIDADLVTLSACNTALGQEQAGEGLISLTRAFQFAGAHSVLASLWSVDDRKTSLLMERFYTELRSGKTKDEALRAAQISLLRAPGTARPLYWAAFVLNGDWR
jgi:CHAT domain-containing protein/Tfp pilus assembly protein PilF